MMGGGVRKERHTKLFFAHLSGKLEESCSQGGGTICIMRLFLEFTKPLPKKKFFKKKDILRRGGKSGRMEEWQDH